MTSARCEIITGNCAGWCAGRLSTMLLCAELGWWQIWDGAWDERLCLRCLRTSVFGKTSYFDNFLGVKSFWAFTGILDGRRLGSGQRLGLDSRRVCSSDLCRRSRWPDTWVRRRSFKPFTCNIVLLNDLYSELKDLQITFKLLTNTCYLSCTRGLKTFLETNFDKTL